MPKTELLPPVSFEFEIDRRLEFTNCKRITAVKSDEQEPRTAGREKSR